MSPSQVILVRSAAAPTLPTGRSIDIRPGGVAAFDGDRVRYPLSVINEDRVIQIDWMSLGALDRALTGALRDGSVEAVRFGDRSICQTALGSERVELIEQRLASIARRERTTLVTWTRSPPREADFRTYNVVVDGPPGEPD